ncbi:MAG: Glucose-1-phosphate cytidylyltransferase (CDP-glucose pyrophosphorylase) [Parcubacteria group bacterium GW2011_GWC2_42_12]|uniref:Glucose-1-phosphate cytidylyltransferase n=1 Tax=Candidatus Falkowbacteria bacterium RIFCSPHIGHO2_02_FULL_42_9 TaxID=1797986 RepID=A0A1F5SA99_9BACT|nr:MAG: Glucose-1-phosphate cytidylyltransferase (CDP-glucose pyrophosphorylase) [Parcubacteria group bacterium GW2011_GWC2_42_12]OGF23587.1 MAG: glucose-1-phosphate cytidylyltransferase [Candidatus Falkowbacteria bacterium RIFCSPHIGHO2_02_FULL_42_9]
MKIIILAGGLGTRLGQITEKVPKPMAIIGTAPMIWHIMKIYSHYNYNDFIISAGYKQGMIKEYFDVHKETGWQVSVIDTGINTLKGARIKRLEKYLNDDLIMATYGDGVANLNIDELVKFHKSHDKILTITGVRPPARFGEIIEKDSRVIRFNEKPQSSTGLINGGFFVFDKRLLEYLSADENCDLEYGPLEELAALGEVMVYKHPGDWVCVDTGRELKMVNKLWGEGNAFWKIWQ